MISEQLRRARTFELENETAIRPEQRPAFHLCARVGWMNDPNGFSLYEGRYHLFYQYHPYDSHWGPMHWGHAVSRDLLRWEYLPAALAPDAPYDREGCFSGSALTLPDGRQMLMYTGVRRDEATQGIVQAQCLAFGDGLDYDKFAGNPVIGAELLPPGASVSDFRDPKLLPLPDGRVRAVAASDQPGEGSRILLYESDDLLHWRLVSVLAENRRRYGLMWECPDLFSLDGTDVLLVSAQDMLPQGFEYHNGFGTVAFLGRFDPEGGSFTPESDQAVDYGIDFYAPQTLLSPDGRRIMIGWMQNWDTCNLQFRSTPWFGQMTLPRELSVKNGRLYQQPIRELEQLRRDGREYRNLVIENNEISLPGVSGRQLDLEIELVPLGELHRFAVRFAKDEDYHTGVSFRPHESVLKIDRKFSGSRRAIIHQRRAKVRYEGGRLRLRLILDRYSVEVFVNGGEKVLSANLSTRLSAEAVSFYVDGKAAVSVRAWRLG